MCVGRCLNTVFFFYLNLGNNLHDYNGNIITYEIILKRTLVFVLAVPVHQKIDL